MHSSSWHVLHVLSNREKRVAQHLAVRSIEYYLPLYRERVKWTDRTVVAERPLFSGYVFARVTPQSRLAVISTPGVLHLLGDEERNMLCEEEVDRIREGLASGLPMRPYNGIAVGTRVQIRDGVFAGIEGVVTELRKQCRVIITLAAVRQCFSVESALDNLTVLDKPAAAPRLNAVSACGY